MIAGFHEATGVTETTDGGATWKDIATTGSGNSIYPFFIDMGNADSTRTTWLTISQEGSGGQPYRTTNSGTNWASAGGFNHPHGASQIFQAGGGVVFVAGSQGVIKSTDYGVSWTSPSGPYEAVIIGTPTMLYASSSVNFSPGPPAIRSAPRDPGTNWSDMTLPDTLKHGAKRLAVTYDQTHWIVVAGSWMSGIWRYVEP
jgi:photosystem II stability/assembly factor-like uncharacterized protein